MTVPLQFLSNSPLIGYCKTTLYSLRRCPCLRIKSAKKIVFMQLQIYVAWQFVQESVKEGSKDPSKFVVAISVTLNFKGMYKTFSCTKWSCQPYCYHLNDENRFPVRTCITILPNIECYVMWPSGFAESQ